MTIALLALIAVAISASWVALRVIMLIWNSPLFWFAAFVLAAALFPITAGISPAVFVALVVLRVVLMGRLFDAAADRRAQQ